MIKQIVYIIVFCFASLFSGIAQDSLQIYVVHVGGDTTNHCIDVYDESYSIVFKRKTDQIYFNKETALQLFDNYLTITEQVSRKSNRID